MPSGEVTLKEALERVDSNNLKERVAGVDDLKHILRSNAKLTSLSDKAFHSIYEALFRIAISEQSTHLKAKTTTTRSAAENRLSACATTLRLAVEAGVRILKLKTVRALLDHLLHTLLLPNGAFCEPLATDYARCLKALLSYQAIVEHLNEHDRERVALFCVECIKIAGSELADDDTVPGAEVSSTHGAINGVSYRSSRSNFKESAESQGSRSLAKQIAGEMVVCISLLTSAPNATYGKKSETLLSCLIETLKNSAISASSHRDAFAAVNHILARTRTENLALTQKITSPLLRLLRHYWALKPTPSLKEEMLIAWLHLRPYIVAAMQGDGDPTLRSELGNTLDVMKSEYINWNAREQMRMDDLTLELDSGFDRSKYIFMPIFRLRSIGPRAETSWATIYIMASLCNVLSYDDQEATSSDDEEEDGINQRPRKRQRMTDEFEEALNNSATGSAVSRMCALQILAFLAQQRTFSVRQLMKAITTLSATCAEDNATLSPWALLALASFASQTVAVAACLSNRWIGVWQLASRAMSNASTCRPACHLLLIIATLRLVPQPNISELVQTMSASMDLNGPSILADSVTNLLAFVVRQSQQISPASASTTAESTLTWLLRNFIPSKFEDRTYAAQHGLFESGHVVDLVACCLGQPHHASTTLHFPTWNSVGQSWLACEAQQDLIAYLLLLPEHHTITDVKIKRQQSSTVTSQSRAACEVFLLNHLISELHKTQEAWNVCIQDNPQGISSDVFAFFCKSCSIAACVASCSSLRDTRRQAQLQKQVQRLLKSLVDFVSGLKCTQEKVDLMLSAFSGMCPRLSSPEIQPQSQECERLICQTIYDSIEARKKNRELDSQDNDEDPMGWDDAHESQDSKPGDPFFGAGDLRNELAIRFSSLALRSSVSLYAAIVTLQGSSSVSTGTTSTSGIITDYILELPVPSILSSSPVICKLEDLEIDINSDDAERILDFFTANVLSSYHHERNEVALTSILDVMSSLTRLWMGADHKELFDLGLDMYSWFTTTALSAGVLSPSVQQRVASLLLQLCHVDTEYGSAADVPSVRTSLFKVLQLGSIGVQFHMANRVSTIFGLFVLSNHSAMFDDLQTSLVSDPNWIEGMSMRLLIFSRLASAWPSLLRQCVFYIFETAGRVERTAQYAARGIRELSQSLQFKSPRKLFRLFAPQLLHSWLEGNQVTNLPFSIFEYDSLGALIAHNEAEITAQLVMHGNDEGMQVVTSALKTTSTNLVTKSFAKCAAYCLSWDVATPPSKGNEDTAESRLRALVGGKEEHKRMLVGHFAAIMGQFYLSLNQDDAQDGWLGKRKEHGSAAGALAKMKSISHSERALPGNQQPSFRSRNLCDQIERLCRRTGHDPVKPWEAASLSVASRIIFDSIDDALGSLHTCLMIRRLRLLIAMAGDVALSGIPLEISIHTLRSFLSNSECADDVIGVVQYLFHLGVEYLQTKPSFVYGTVTTMVLQMRRHASTKQDSTTQGSQHKDTVQRMEKLQVWLVNFLQKIQLSETSLSGDCSTLAQSLAHVELPGNARSGSPESSLLLLLLREERASTRLLQQADSDEALALLSHSFEVPATASEDCLEHDEDCVRIAPQLWRSLQTTSLGQSFIIWAARVLGRSYASTGTRPSSIRKEPSSAADSVTQQEVTARSQSKIAQRLAKSFFSRDRMEASIADYTLREIMQSFRDAEEALAFEQWLPSAIATAILGGTHGYQPVSASSNLLGSTGPSPLNRLLEPASDTSLETWVQQLGLRLCQDATDVPILRALTMAIQNIDGLALDILPCIVHILLAREIDKKSVLRTQLSASLLAHLTDVSDAIRKKHQYLLELVLYLRGQALPGESTPADRLRWLDVDWLMAAQSADRCDMPTAALLFAESASRPSHSSKRASSRASTSQLSIAQIPDELLLSIFKHVDEPDSFYGVEQSASLDSVLERLDYEGDGLRSLMLRSAQADNNLRRSHDVKGMNSSGMIHSLSMLNLNSLAFALLNGGFSASTTPEDLFDSARRLQQWDIVPPESTTESASNTFAALQALSRATERGALQARIQSIMVSQVNAATREHAVEPSLAWYSSLASLVEINEIIGLSGQSAIRSSWTQMQSRQSWMTLARFDDFRSILSNRNTLFSVLVQNKSLSAAMGMGMKDSRIIEIETLLEISRFARGHDQLQESLAAVSQIGDLIGECKELGLKADAAASFETASVLWSSGEVAASMKMLRNAINGSELEHQDISVGRSGLEAQLAHQLAEARLEAPDQILSKYLKPAITHLQGRNEGREAGTVYHEFASFCDKQLQNPGNIEDYNRVAKLRQSKLEEVQELERLPMRSKLSADEKDKHARDMRTAKQWLNLDNANFERLKQSRDLFLQQSLQNYLLALRASDEHDISVLRFFALWLENSEAVDANEVVARCLSGVPSWKFVVLMNQLMSRLEQDGSIFQRSLKSLTHRICSEHPHHGLHHLFATTRQPTSGDHASRSRYEVATNIRQQLTNGPQKGALLDNIFKADKAYEAVARFNAKEIRGNKIALKDVSEAYSMSKSILKLQVPPATIHLPLRPDGDYHSVPIITKFSSLIGLMSGISRPKKVTAYASDGQPYGQLLKSGDDLRQDAIMEQVFEEVSKMLRNHQATRQRNLHVRTYKVIPLSAQSGIIEFVPNSTSFTDFLVSAHERYYPQDYKNNKARQIITAAKEHSVETRVKEYRKLCDHMHPVMRHFFFERYNDPDDWFEKRTAYTRTTATISILGHVLGLGDRHCQNIMLDETTGEVVHIDLGVAFEAGRVLPIPELVPFRLTRDVIDGMGITKTEGVFRRCCEFTMDSLRDDKDSIMTLLNVLRYDPLYTWSVSPLRAKRMQEETGRNVGKAETGEGSSKKREQEAGEADRALSIVEKKLSKTLSTAATVNELIQQATDERNLATLFSGWSAWF